MPPNLGRTSSFLVRIKYLRYLKLTEMDSDMPSLVPSLFRVQPSGRSQKPSKLHEALPVCPAIQSSEILEASTNRRDVARFM